MSLSLRSPFAILLLSASPLAAQPTAGADGMNIGSGGPVDPSTNDEEGEPDERQFEQGEREDEPDAVEEEADGHDERGQTQDGVRARDLAGGQGAVAPQGPFARHARRPGFT